MNCYICNGELKELGNIPFGKNEGTLPCTDNTPILYHKCKSCNFICSIDMLKWTPEQFRDKVYTEDYAQVDTGYGGERAKNNEELISHLYKNRIKHLDYGSGEGHLSSLLTKKGWDSTYYDPYTSPSRPTDKYKLITVIEVLEHSTNVFDLLEDIKSFLHSDGIIQFSTRLADENTKIDWWYICARAGHVGIHSEKSMKIVATKHNLFYSSIDPLVHIMQPSRNNFKELMRGYK